MLALAAKRAPRAEFRRESFISADIPACLAVTAMARSSITSSTAATGARGFRPSLAAFMKRFARADCSCSTSRSRAASATGGTSGAIRRAPGGRASIPPRKTGGERRSRGRSRRSEKWAKNYRRHREVHRLKLFPRSEVAQMLRSAGFQVSTLSGYARFRFPGRLGRIPRPQGIAISAALGLAGRPDGE